MARIIEFAGRFGDVGDLSGSDRMVGRHSLEPCRPSRAGGWAGRLPQFLGLVGGSGGVGGTGGTSGSVEAVPIGDFAVGVVPVGAAPVGVVPADTVSVDTGPVDVPSPVVAVSAVVPNGVVAVPAGAA